MIAAYMPMIDMAHPLSGSSGGEGSSEEDERPQAREAAGSAPRFRLSAEDADADERARDDADPQRSWSPSDLLASGGGSPVAPAEDVETQDDADAGGSVPTAAEPVRRCSSCLSLLASCMLSLM